MSFAPPPCRMPFGQSQDIPQTDRALGPGIEILSYDDRKPTSVKQFVDSVVDASGRQSRSLIVRRGSNELKFEVAPGRLGINIQNGSGDGTGADAGKSSPSPSQPIARSP